MKKSFTNQPATKADIKRIEVSLTKFATKTELKNTERNLRSEMLRVEEKVENLEDKITKQHDEVMTAVSNFAGRVETLEKENEIGSGQIRRLDERITSLEPTT